MYTHRFPTDKWEQNKLYLVCVCHSTGNRGHISLHIFFSFFFITNIPLCASVCILQPFLLSLRLGTSCLHILGCPLSQCTLSSVYPPSNPNTHTHTHTHTHTQVMALLIYPPISFFFSFTHMKVQLFTALDWLVFLNHLPQLIHANQFGSCPNKTHYGLLIDFIL